jgi:hypothetical protein
VEENYNCWVHGGFFPANPPAEVSVTLFPDRKSTGPFSCGHFLLFRGKQAIPVNLKEYLELQ